MPYKLDVDELKVRRLVERGYARHRIAASLRLTEEQLVGWCRRRGVPLTRDAAGGETPAAASGPAPGLNYGRGPGALAEVLGTDLPPPPAPRVEVGPPADPRERLQPAGVAAALGAAPMVPGQAPLPAPAIAPAVVPPPVRQPTASPTAPAADGMHVNPAARHLPRRVTVWIRDAKGERHRVELQCAGAADADVALAFASTFGFQAHIAQGEGVPS